MNPKLDARWKKPGSRRTLPSVAVYCQGTRTEVDYFGRLKEHYNLTYQVHSDAKNPAWLVKQASKIAYQNGYDEVYVVVDVDETPFQEFEQAIAECR